MSRYGVEQKLYHCPKIKIKVILSLYYGIYKGETIYSSVDCSHKTKCGYRGVEVVTESCPAHQHYIRGGIN